ncbi:MAG: GxxExxY protein [Candidatus Moranbacteria bacterium]|nr:GxxExxY protein [Candidatus Moranbacteria bacterium]
MTIFTKKGEILLYEKESYFVRGLFFKIYNELGPGHKESVYSKALVQEFKESKVPFESEKHLKIIRNKEILGTFRVDFVIWDKMIIELKALEFLPIISERQIQSYLSGSKYKLAFLVNFGAKKLEIIRKVNDKAKKSAISAQSALFA